MVVTPIKNKIFAMKAKDSMKIFSKAIAIPAIIAVSAILSECTVDEKRKKSVSENHSVEQLD